MSLDYVKFSPGFDKFMPKEYRDMVEHGPFGKKISVSQMGSFKEILEEHPMCAGCAMTLFIRLAIIAFPNPEDTITVGTAGCGRLAISQAAIPFVYGNCGDQNGVASGLSRGLRLRFGDQPKDVVVMVGDGGMADIGFSGTLHSWFRKEKFTTIMLDNEVYGNTGGQESGMTNKGQVLKMAPLGKKFEKMDMIGMASSLAVRMWRPWCRTIRGVSRASSKKRSSSRARLGQPTFRPTPPATSSTPSRRTRLWKTRRPLKTIATSSKNTSATKPRSI